MRSILRIISTVVLIHGLASSQGSDSIRITLERVCTGLGLFTEYRLTITGNGLLIREEKQDSCGIFRAYAPFVEKARAYISPNAVRSLVQDFLKMGYFSFEDRYDSKVKRSAPGEPPSYSIEMVPDLHTCVTSLRIGNRTKRVVNYYGAPPKLSVAEDRIDSLAGMPDFNRDMKKLLK